MKYESLSFRLGIVLLISTALAGCVNKAQPNFERPPAPVVVSTAVSQDVSNYMDALGKIVARETVAIQPQVSGRIEKIHFADGANVRKGQLLFTIDPRPFDANVKQAQANLAKDTAARIAFVSLYLRKGDTASANREHGGVLDFGPTGPDGRVSRALDYVSVGRRDDAKHVLHEAIQADRTAASAARLLAAMSISDGSAAEGAKFLEPVLAGDAR